MIRWAGRQWGRFLCAILLHKERWVRTDPGFRQFITPTTTPRTLLHLLFLDTVLSRLWCECARCGTLLGC